MNIDNYRNILDKLSPYGAKLIVVSKYKSFDEIETVKNWGQNIFGENRVQELVAKNELHGINLEWHLIGSLQKNKVKSIIPIVKLIHSVDSLSLLQEINKQAQAGGGYTDYWFYKKDDTKPLAKRAYSELFKPFNWVVGTGYYLEDVK